MAPILLLLLLVLSSLLPLAAPGAIGVCHGRVGTGLPSPAEVVGHLHSHNITKLRLFNPDPSVLPAFKNSGIKLTVGVPNENLTSLSESPDAAAQWLKSNLLAHVSPDDVQYLAVGNEILYKDAFYTPNLVPAMRNLRTALQTLGGLDRKIKISSPHASSVLSVSHPPSNGTFDPFVLPVLREMLGFLSETGAPLMVNVYPFISYCEDPFNIPLGFASFGDLQRLRDGPLTYTDLFDASVDAFVAAMEREGFAGVPVAVAETGWPTAGNDAATKENAESFNREMVRKVTNDRGTPRRPGVAVETFLFDLYDENRKGGAEFERHFGILNVDGTTVYDISFDTAPPDFKF